MTADSYKRQDVETSVHYGKADLSAVTRDRYKAAWRRFEAWGWAHGRTVFPAAPADVIAYIESLAHDAGPWARVEEAKRTIRQVHLTNSAKDPTRGRPFAPWWSRFEAKMRSAGIAPPARPGAAAGPRGPQGGHNDPKTPEPVKDVARAKGADALAAAIELACADLNDHTARSYERAGRRFGRWCVKRGHRPYPATANSVAAYMLERASHDGVTRKTVQHELSALRAIHARTGLRHLNDDPAIASAWCRIQDLRAAPRGDQTVGATPGVFGREVLRMAAACPSTPKGLRDRAVILTLHVTAATRDELAAMNVADAATLPEIRISGTRTELDETDELARAAANALLEWLVHAHEGAEPDAPLFTAATSGARLRPADITAIVRAAAREAGIAGRITPRSLRRGRLVEAALAGASELDLQRIGRLADLATARKHLGIASMRRATPVSCPMPEDTHERVPGNTGSQNVPARPVPAQLADVDPDTRGSASIAQLAASMLLTAALTILQRSA